MIDVLVSSVGDPCADTNVVNKLLVPKTYSDRRLIAIIEFFGILQPTNNNKHCFLDGPK